MVINPSASLLPRPSHHQRVSNVVNNYRFQFNQSVVHCHQAQRCFWLKAKEIAMSATIDIGTLIVRSPEIRNGQPRLAETGVTVRRIVGWYKLGLNPEEIAEEIGHLTLAQVHAALAYYHANQDEIEAIIAAEEKLAVELEQKHYQQRQEAA
jgi:uncharacterized protein (DUF433 family)